MSFPKIIYNDSFDYGNLDLLVTIVDDPAVLKKTASSEVSHQWGELVPIKDHSIIHLISHGELEKTGCNRNGDAFRRDFCASSHPTFLKHGALYRDHKNKDYSKREGDILKTAHNAAMGRVELAVAANHEKCADWLSKIERGEKVAFSMGFDCKYDVCSYCGNKAKTRRDYCEHVGKHATSPFGMCRILPDGRKCYVDNPEGVWNDISYVNKGADMIAQHLRKVASLSEDTVITSADLAEEFLGDNKFNSMKSAIAHKLSQMEKRVDGILVVTRQRSDEKLHPKTASRLREMMGKEAFGELASLQAVLPFLDFYKLAYGPHYEEQKDNLEKAALYLDSCFTDIIRSPERLERVCSNTCYDANKTAGSRLTEVERYNISSEYSLSSEAIVLHKAASLVPLQFSKTADTTEKRKVDFLLEEYAAYKVAALDAMDIPLTGDVLLNAILLN